ncbi:MAG: argininosuccinate lyase [Acidobacteria bacterium]|nr:argininosuccinate lyase [Acidobacteriota bacterium]
MKRAFWCWSVVCAVGLSTTVAAVDLDFTLVNKTGFIIEELYVSPSEEDTWGADVLGRDVLPDGDTATINFSRRETACMWDIRTIDEDGDEVVWTEINLCRAVRISLFYDADGPVADIEE